MRIYVAGEYSQGDTLSEERRVKNTDMAIRAGVELVKRGHWTLIPHLTHYVEQHAPKQLSYRDYMLWDREFMQFCDAIFVLSGSHTSSGVKTEIEWFKQRGLPVYYNIADIPEDPYRKMGLS